MTTYKKGMDPEALHRAAGRIRGAKHDVDAVRDTVARVVDRLGSNWAGGNLERLIQEYRSTSAPALAHLGGRLDDMARTIDRNVSAQRRTSDERSTAQAGRTTWMPAGGAAFSGKRPWSRTNRDADGGTHTRTQYGPYSRYDTERTQGELDGEDGRTTTRTTQFRHNGNAADNPNLYESRETSTTRGHVDANGEHSRTTSRRDSTLFGRFNETEWGLKSTHSHAWGENEWEDGRKSPDWGKNVSVKIASGDIDGLNSEHYAKTVGGDHANVKLWGTETDGRWDVSVKDGNLVAAATAGAGAYALKAHADGSTQLGALGLNGKADAAVGAEANATGSASIGKDGLNVGGQAEAMVGAKVSAEGGANLGPLHAKVAGHAMAGAEASANGSVGIGVEGVKAQAGLDAFAGAKAGADGEFGVSGVTGKVGGEVYAGIGGHAKVDVQANFNHIKADVDVGAAIGVGGGVKFAVDVEPKQVINDVSRYGGGFVHGVTSTGDVLGHGLKNVFGW